MKFRLLFISCFVLAVSCTKRSQTFQTNRLDAQALSICIKEEVFLRSKLHNGSTEKSDIVSNTPKRILPSEKVQTDRLPVSHQGGLLNKSRTGKTSIKHPKNVVQNLWNGHDDLGIFSLALTAAIIGVPQLLFPGFGEVGLIVTAVLLSLFFFSLGVYSLLRDDWDKPKPKIEDSLPDKTMSPYAAHNFDVYYLIGIVLAAISYGFGGVPLFLVAYLNAVASGDKKRKDAAGYTLLGLILLLGAVVAGLVGFFSTEINILLTLIGITGTALGVYGFYLYCCIPWTKIEKKTTL